VIVAELVPAVVVWNRGPLAALAGHPLQDDRVTVREVDIACILKGEPQSYDAILQDVDNGPEGLIRTGNDWLYARAGLDAALAALRPGECWRSGRPVPIRPSPSVCAGSGSKWTRSVREREAPWGRAAHDLARRARSLTGRARVTEPADRHGHRP